mmetsp:Transcript_125125/g.350387  ORF Transcript_125125/g.350387 Transcript_125125/m.350387 type:complete len:231 (+) Transcript_125125:625-1317(+)
MRVAPQALAVALRWEGGAGAGDVHRGAAPVHKGADAVLAVARARHVRLRGLVTDAYAGGVRQPLEPDVDGVYPAAEARAQRGLPREYLAYAIEHVLHGEVDVDAAAPAQDLDAVCERGELAVGPAAAAVLWHVLVAAHGAEAALLREALEVAPVPAGVVGRGQRRPRGRGGAVHARLQVAGWQDDLRGPPGALRHRGEAHDLGPRAGLAARALDETHLLHGALALAGRRA